MATTAQYFKKALISLVNKAFDSTAQTSNSNEYEDILPDFRHHADSPELCDDNLNRRVEEALSTPDRPALKEGDHAGLQFLEDSSHIKDIMHSAECPGVCNKSHTEWLDDDVFPGFVKYWVTWAYKPGYLGMGAKVPEYLHEYLRRALLMQNLCEWAVVILFQSVKDIVKQIDPQAEIYQMVVAPRRRFQIINDSGMIAGTHSLFLVSSPLAGDFILDPTAEQYGIPHEHRFLPWSIYKQLYVIDQKKFCGAAVWSIDFQPYMHNLQLYGSWAFWDSVRTVLNTQTAAWLEDCDLRPVMDDEEQWNLKVEQLERMVMDGLHTVKAGPET